MKSKILWITDEDILDLFMRIAMRDIISLPIVELPIGTRITGSIFSSERNCYGIFLENADWPDIPAGEIPPTLVLKKKLYHSFNFCSLCDEPVFANSRHDCKKKNLLKSITKMMGEMINDPNAFNNTPIKSILVAKDLITCKHCSYKFSESLDSCPQCYSAAHN
jgi:hypothetical protein